MKPARSVLRRQRFWKRAFSAASYLRSALWTVPLLSLLLVLPLGPVLRILDTSLGWRLTGLGPQGAETLYQTVITLALSFMVFTFGSLLVAIQVAGGQMTPRIIATLLLRDNVIRYSVGLFVFALVFSVMALNRLEASVHEIVALVAAALGVMCVVTFLFLIDYSARLLRPVSVLTRVAEDGLAVIHAVYPYALARAGEADELAMSPAYPRERRTVVHDGHSGIVLAVDVESLVVQAEEARGQIEFLPQVGDFVATDEPLFVLYGGAMAMDERALDAAVAFGPERTLQQDPLFAFRIVADIALKALSPAINDPTTAVLAIDQLHRLLRAAGGRHLRQSAFAGRDDVPRVIFRTPNWEDFMHLACTEIRMCGAGNVQVARRLYAMLDNLAVSLPAVRVTAILAERRRLDLATEAAFIVSDDRTLARVADSQGLGSSAVTE